MKELSLHIMDIVENSIRGNAEMIRLTINENIKDNDLSIVVEDDGNGIPDALIQTITDPFVTSRTERRVGMGLSLFKASAERCSGHFSITSKEEVGTTVSVSYVYDHIDRAPLGDMAMTLSTLIAGYPDINLYYSHSINGNEFTFSTDETKEALGGVPLNEPQVLAYLKGAIRDALSEIKNLKKKTEV